jgi:hypothetical protein
MTSRKLESYQVILIRQMRREGFTRSFLSRLFGISKSTLHQLLARSTYKDVR